MQTIDLSRAHFELYLIRRKGRGGESVKDTRKRKRKEKTSSS